jgi:hypothetical protein
LWHGSVHGVSGIRFDCCHADPRCADYLHEQREKVMKWLWSLITLPFRIITWPFRHMPGYQGGKKIANWANKE